MLIFLFGYPGVGKNFIGQLLEEKYGFYFYDADLDGTEAMKQAIAEHRLFTDEMRDEYYRIVIDRIRELRKKHPKLVIAQGLAKNKHRAWFREAFPGMKFLWVDCDEALMINRLKQRTAPIVITEDYALMVKSIFETPDFDCPKIENNSNKEMLLKKLELVVK